MSSWLFRVCRDWQPLSSFSSHKTAPHQDNDADNLTVPELRAVCLLHFQPNKEYESFIQSNTDTPGAHLAQKMHFFALCEGAVGFSSSVYHPSPLCSSCFCNQEVDRQNSYDCFSFSFKTLCLVSALTHTYCNPPQTGCIYSHAKQLKTQRQSKPYINILTEIIIWLLKSKCILLSNYSNFTSI